MTSRMTLNGMPIMAAIATRRAIIRRNLEQRHRLLSRHEAGESQRALAREIGVSRGWIQQQIHRAKLERTVVLAYAVAPARVL